MKKSLAILLVLTLMIGLCACTAEVPASTKAPTAAPTEQAPTSEPETEATEEPSTAETPATGDYSNADLGVTCTLPEGWTSATQEELAQLSGIVAENIDDEAFQERLESSGVIFDYYAEYEDKSQSINVVIENISLLFGVLYDEDALIEQSLSQVEQSLTDSGMTVQSVEKGTTTFAGETCNCILIEATTNDVPIHEIQVIRISGNKAYYITAACYYDNYCNELLTFFAPAA